MRKLTSFFKREPVKQEEHVGEDEYVIQLHLKDGQLSVAVDWGDGFNPKMMGALVGTIATGEIVGPVLNEVAQKLEADGEKQELEAVHEAIRFRINQHRQAAFNEDDDDEPVIQPIEAIRRQLTMYQSNQE